MATLVNITANELSNLVSYDPDTGFFTWLPRTPNMYRQGRQTPEGLCGKFNRDKAGQRADCHGHRGYRRIGLPTGGYIYASYAAWLLTYGVLPQEEIDHANTDPSDNRIDNLRLATSSQQKANRRAGRKDKVLPKGVGWHAQRQRYRAYIGSKHLGLFATVEEAQAAYEAAAMDAFGEFARVQ